MGFFKNKKTESIGHKLLMMLTGGAQSASDPLYNSAFWACIMNLAKMYATLPLHAFKRNSQGVPTQLPNTSYLARLMHHPNPLMTSYQFWFVMGINLEMHGEACAILERSPSTGYVKNIFPVSPNSMIRYIEDGEEYYVLAPTGTRYSHSDVLVISGTPSGYNSVLSPIQYATDSVDLDMKVKRMQSDYLDGSSVVGNIVTVPRNIDDEGMARLKATFDTSKGFHNFVVKEGVKVTPLQVGTGDIGKLTDASTWSAREIARRFQVPPFFIGDTSVPMGNAEQQGIEMVVYCLQPRVRAIEIALDDALCTGQEYFRFSLQGLMRGDHASRSAFYHNAIMDGWMSHNEVRALEELAPIEDGDTHFFPMNYATIGDIVAGKFANNGSPWDMSTESRKDSHTQPSTHTHELTEAERLAEKKKKDLCFYEEATKPVKTSRQKLERMLRKQIKAEIEELTSMIAQGGATEAVLASWTEWLNTNAKELAPQYVALYTDVIKRMLPRVKQEVGSDIEVSDDRMEGFADKYTSDLMARHTGYVHNRVSGVIGTDNFDDAMDSLKQDYPMIESKEEVNRSFNAFSVFLYGALGLEYMHSVAHADACAFCAKLDGKICSVNGYVLDKGSDMEDGDGNIRHIKKNYRHPPYHSSCSCFMAPGK